MPVFNSSRLSRQTSIILMEPSSVDPVKPDDGVDMTQISIMDAKNDTIFHISIRQGQGQIIFNSKFGGSWGEEEGIDIDRRFDSEDGATILIHGQGEGFEVSIDRVHAIWFSKRTQGTTPQSIQYDLWNKEGTSALVEDLEVRTYPSMKALFLQKHAHEEEK
ncbi:unnamed protein product [Penicillium egyptiacum]|uniref:Galectin n=1 Tax=Penicillium egyptiacum TaxID=1303716 RepID=A0A9W4KDR2_9EURO|nr:unnamed protein product [Penicillium egyptiacum]